MKTHKIAEKQSEKLDLEDYAYRAIIRMIFESKKRPGDAILETELAETLGISRTPIRQALGKLVTEGFLEKKRKKGCVIPFPSPEDAKQVFLAREILESQVAKEAALRATKNDVERLRQILEKEDEAIVSYDQEGYALTNEKFHLGLVKVIENSYLEQYCRHIFWRSNVYIFFFDSFYIKNNKLIKPRQLTPIQHRRIVKAIELKDPVQAKLEMKTHIRNTFNSIMRLGNS